MAKLEGGYECQFIDPPKELQSECPICLHVIREPYLVDCCGYRFCRTCIKNVEADDKPCPMCNATFATVPDKFLQRKLLERKVACIHKVDGCKWTGKLRHFEEHLNLEFCSTHRLIGCGFVEVECMYCEDPYYRKEIEKHESHCPRKPILCKYCKKYSGLEDDLADHHWPNDCPSFPVPCSNKCGKICKRVGVNDHIKQHCPLAPVECEFAEMGCKDLICRKDLKEHMEAKALQHVSLLSDHIKGLNVRIKQQDEEHTQLCLDLEEKENDVALKEDELTWKECDIAYRDYEMHRMSKEVSEKDDEIAELREQVEELSQPPQPSSSRVLLVTNCPPATNGHKLRSIFGQFGLMRHLEWNYQSSYALVYYYHTESVQKALNKYHRVGIRLHQMSLEIYRI